MPEDAGLGGVPPGDPKGWLAGGVALWWGAVGQGRGWDCLSDAGSRGRLRDGCVEVQCDGCGGTEDLLCRSPLLLLLKRKGSRSLPPPGPSGEGQTWGGMEDELDTLLSKGLGSALAAASSPGVLGQPVGRDDVPNRGCSTSAVFPVLIHHPCRSEILWVVQVSSPCLSGPGGPLCSLSVPFEL